MQSGKSVAVIMSGHAAERCGTGVMPAAESAADGSDTPRFTRRHERALVSGWLALILLVPLICPAQTREAMPEEAAEVARVPVTLDGETLFLVRGTSAFPAEKRAAAIADRILAAAKDPAYVTGSLKAVDEDGFTRIEARGQLLVALTDTDAAAEGVARPTLVKVLISRIDEAIAAYREIRGTGNATPELISPDRRIPSGNSGVALPVP